MKLLKRIYSGKIWSRRFMFVCLLRTAIIVGYLFAIVLLTSGLDRVLSITLRAEPRYQLNDTATQGTIVIKTADESVTNNTYQDDNELFFPVEANGEYRWEMKIYLVTNTTADFKFQFTGPAAATYVTYHGWGFTSGNAYTTCGVVATAFSTSQPASGYGAENLLIMKGYLLNGANAGTVMFQWAQNTTAGTTTLKRGCTLEWIKLN